jgi:hypothetical protein
MDWHAWHLAYDSPDSALTRRLQVVRQRIGLALDEAPPGPLRAISVCAGQGRDLIGALSGHPRRADVSARLVELDPRNTGEARRAAADLGLDGVEVVTGDASLTDAYAGMTPAHLTLLCGLFGNVTDADIVRTIGHATALCATGGTLVWTRHRRPPGVIDVICAALETRGFERVWLNDPQDPQGIGVHRYTGTPQPLAPGATMFRFIGYDVLDSSAAQGD